MTLPAGPPPGRKTWRTRARPASPLADNPLTIIEFKKNRRAESVRVTLKEYEGHDLFDLRTWFNGEDGVSRPGKGFCCSAHHLPTLRKAIGKALEKAIELGIVATERDE